MTTADAGRGGRSGVERVRAGLLRGLDHPRAPLAIVGLGLAIRLIALALLFRTPLDGDALSYHETAVNLARGVDYEPHWPPGLPGFLSIAYRFHESMVVGRAMMLVVYVVFCSLVLALGRRLVGPRATNLALAVFALTPIFIWTSVNPLTQLFSATLVLGAVHFADRSREEPSLARSATLLGICLAGLVLTRPSNMAITAVVPLYLAWRTRRWQTLVTAAVVTVIVGAWLHRTHEMTGRHVFINDANSQNIYYGNNPWTPTYRTWWFGSHHADEGDPTVPGEFFQSLRAIGEKPMQERDRLYVRGALEHIRARPDLFVVRTASRVRTFAAFETYTSSQLALRSKLLGMAAFGLDAFSYVLLAGLALLFPALVREDRVARGAVAPLPTTPPASSLFDPETVRLLLLVAFLYALPYFLIFAHPTFHFSVVPLVSILGAAVAVRALESGFRPLWAALSRRGRIATVAGYLGFFAIQIEWAIDVFSRA